MLSALDTNTDNGTAREAGNQQVRIHVHRRLKLATLPLFTFESSYDEGQKVAAINGGEKYAESVLR
jgi:hypothetical protein